MGLQPWGRWQSARTMVTMGCLVVASGAALAFWRKRRLKDRGEHGPESSTVNDVVQAFCEGEAVVANQRFFTHSEESIEILEGTPGVILEIDSDGDARIRFQGHQKSQWVFKPKLNVLTKASVTDSEPSVMEENFSIPPIVPHLVSQSDSSFFALPIDQLVAGAHSVNVVNTNGNISVRIVVSVQDTGERVIEICTDTPSGCTLASISAPSECKQRTPFEIKAKAGEHYGWLRPAHHGCYIKYVLACGDESVMLVNPAVRIGKGECQFYACKDGELLAQISRSGDAERHFATEDLELNVTPGLDPAPVILCVLAVVFFGRGKSEFMFPPAQTA